MSYRVAPLEREPAYMKVCHALEQDIIDGRLDVGDRLPTETDLAQQFGVNRSTVREGVRLLEQTGLITRGAAKRWVVCRPDASDVANTTSKAISRSGVTFLQAWEALTVIYPQAAALVAERVTPESLEQMRSRIRQEEAIAPDDNAALLETVAGFFSDLVLSVDNPVLQVPLESINLLLQSSLEKILHATPDARTRIIAAQRELVSAFENRDPDHAMLWMRRHIADLRRGYQVAGIDTDTRIS